MRKAQDDVMARGAAERLIADYLDLEDAMTPFADGGAGNVRGLVGEFKAVEFERGTSKDPDKQVVPMRRVVLTGPWEVDPDGVANR